MKDDKHMYKTALERFLKLYSMKLSDDWDLVCISDRTGWIIQDSHNKSMKWYKHHQWYFDCKDIYEYILTNLYRKTISYSGNDFYHTNQKFITVPSSYYELMIFLDLNGA